MSVRQFFDAAQEALESGGRQHDKQGKPLVGRYRDGTTPPKGKEAYGAGQMQIGTARNTAKRHGIQWDENRFMNDREYNLSLADAHKGDLMRKYKGNRAHADAAYHSGEPAVDRAIARYGPSGFARGLGPEGRNYVRRLAEARGKNGGGGSAAVSGTQNFFEGLESAIAPEVAASQNVSSNAGAIFGSDERINKETADVRTMQERQKGALGVLDQVAQAAQTQQMSSMIRKVEETRGISDQIVAANQELQRQVRPVFEARWRVANQMDQLAVMNPLEKGIRSIFDLNYDEEYLGGQLKDFDATLDMRMRDFDYLNKLHAVSLGEIERRYGLDTAVSDLLAQQAKEDTTLIGLQLANTQGFLDTSMAEIGNQAQIIAAKAGATRDILGRLDSITMANLMNQAQTSGGVVEYGGVKIAYAQLREALQDKEKQEWAIEGYKIGIASQRMDFAEKSAENIMQYASREQLESWIANGGKATLPDGTTIDLPQDKLTHYLQNHRLREEGMAQDVAAAIPEAQALKMGADAMLQSVGLYQRAAGFFKPGTPQNEQMAGALRSQESALRELIAAQKAGKPQAVINALVEKMSVAQQGVAALVDNTILQSVGGNKQSAQYVSAFVKGIELSDGDAASAVVHFALQGGMPEQLKASPAARQVFGEAMKIVKDHRLDENGKPRSAAALKQIVTDKVLSQAGATVGQQNFERLYNTLPATAREDGNALGRIPQEQWASMRAAAERDAIPGMVSWFQTEKKLPGVTPEKVRIMVQTGRAPGNTPADLRLWEAFNTPEAAGQWNGLEQRKLVEELDDIAPLQPGTANSKLLVDYLRSDKLTQRLERFGSISRNSSFGDYVLSPMINGVLERRVGEFAGILDDSRSAVYQSAQSRAKQFDNAYAKNPIARAHNILSSIDGVGRSGADKLLPFLRSRQNDPAFLVAAAQVGVLEWTNITGVRTPINSRSIVMSQERAMLQALQSTKFDDPVLEALRKKAVSGWDSASTDSGGAVENFMYSLKAAAGS